MIKKFTILFSFLLIASILDIYADKPRYIQIDLKKEVSSTSWIYVKKGVEQAYQEGAKGIILNMNTYGGAVVYADSIRTTLLNSTIPTYVFIDNNAASAGALIAIACDSIYMRRGASIGAATVVNQGGEVMPDKYQSYMRATIRSTAEAKGKHIIVVDGKEQEVWRRDPLIAEAMVDPHVTIPNLIDSGKVLTFTMEEAIRYRFCEGEAESVEQLIRDKLHVAEFELKHYTPTWSDEAMGWLTSPSLQAALIMIIVLGIYYELQTPGMGFPSIAALAAATLYFAPLYFEGLAQYWEIALFVIGLILLAVEVFVLPGFGLAGVTGVLLITGGLILALIHNVDFNFQGVLLRDANRAVMTVVAGLASGFTGILFLLSRIGSKGIFSRVALTKVEKVSDGYIAVPTEGVKFVGKYGVAATVLRPGGKILIDNQYFDAVAIYGFVEAGTSVRVIRYEQAQCYVVEEKIKNEKE